LFVLPVPPEDKPPERLTTVLLPMQVGEIWRVQIVWPNGSVHYFGMYNSREAAVEWITAHAWLTMRPKHRDDASG
jgi:uncharacterized protein YbdZ (MbtH family)